MKRILVVDDESSLLMTLSANLELAGYEVLEAPDGATALALLEQKPVDLVLSDIRMPGMNGVELFHRIRELHPDMPVVLMTAFAVEDLVAEAIQDGAFTVLSKPFDIDQLVQMLAVAVRHPIVLVVDDVVQVAESTADALRASGLRAEAVFDGQAALEVVRKGTADVCVVDLVMPGMDGAELIDRIRAVAPGVVCIVVSGCDVPDLIRKAAAHAQRFLRKPVKAAELVDAVARARAHVT
jgi:DNA-binding NtrC family response regulator